MKLQKVYHMGIPVDNLDRAKEFYTKVLGMEYLDRVGGNPNNPDALPIRGVVQKLDRLRCGDGVAIDGAGALEEHDVIAGRRWHFSPGLRYGLGRLRRSLEDR
jgi:catechol 2,3-dioxygenase-like lactoylglutathione lyase family enzyme